MTIMKNIFLFILFASCLISGVFANNIESINISSRANINESQIRVYCYEKIRCDTILVNKFYINNHFKPVWIHNNKLNVIAIQLINKLQNAELEGLDPKKYHIESIGDLVKKMNNLSADSSTIVDLELSLTNAFFLYTSDLAFGKINNRKFYPKWIIKKRSFDLIALLNQVVSTQNLESALTIINPKFIGYYALKNALHQYQRIAIDGGFESIPQGIALKLRSKGKRVELLHKRLIATGELNPNFIESYNEYSDATKNAVMLFQQNSGIHPTGVLDKATLKALNIPINTLIDKISINMDRMRWLPNNLESSYIWVNIPDFSLHVVENNHNILTMPIIVGKVGTKSCVLDSNIQYMELNPYWNVPKSIAITDILPKLRESPDYLEKKGYTAYKYKISDNTKVDGDEVDWRTVSATNLQYIFRQNPNKHNALGQIKFIFPNECGIYLHDTSQHYLFKNQWRAYSHGCIRVGKPIELASFLLRDQPKYTTNVIESQIQLGKRKVIPLKHKEEVHIVYLTSWVNESGQLQFRPDIYKIDNFKLNVNIKKTSKSPQL